MESITIIILLWKRDYLKEQLDSLANQSVPNLNVLIIQHESFLEVGHLVDSFSSKFSSINLVKSTYNYRYFIRFSIGTITPTDYIFLIDDDVIPSKRWLEICIKKSKEYNAIICCSGRLIPNNDFTPEYIKSDLQKKLFIGDSFLDSTYNFCEEDTLVDYGCNSYFIKSEWLQYFWKIWPYTFYSGDDIHLSASLKLKLSIKTIVPKQIDLESSGNIRREYGADPHASWRSNEFILIREKIFRNLIEVHGWRPLLW